MTSSKISFYFCLCFIGGIFLSSFFFIFSQIIFLSLLILFLLCLVFLFKKYKTLAFVGFCFIFVLLGLWRYQVADLKDSPIKEYNEEKVILLGKVSVEPDIRENSVQLIIQVQKILFKNKVSDISGKVLIKTANYPKYNYADVLAIEGELKTPEIFEGFNYKEYLSKKGIESLLDWPQIELVEKESYSNILEFCYGYILKFKNVIRNNINKNFPYIQSKLLSGILLGDQSSFPDDFKDNLNNTGLRHITAISGMNVAIICIVLMNLFLGFGLWRGQAFYFTSFFIFLFVAMVGFQSSIVRAAIMGVAALLAQKIGRMSANVRIIIMTATIMLLLNPMLLRWDVGFQLSFLAILGIVLLSRPLEDVLKFIPQRVNLKSIVAVTLSAQVFTLPILIYNFGRISLVSPITNILVVPIVDFIMIFGFLFGILNSIWWILGWLFIWPTGFLLSYTIKVIDIFSQPWASKIIENLHSLWLIVLYLLLVVAVSWIKKRERLKNLSY